MKHPPTTAPLRPSRRRTGQQHPNKAVAYLRCSTDRQDLSTDAQREVISTWAAGAGVAVVAWHEDLGVSGGADMDKRPGLLAALDAVRSERAGLLAVAKRDRIARDVLTDALVQRLCEREGATVVSADGVANGDRPEDQLMRSIVAAMAAYERALISARTRAALAVKRSRGQRIGTVPYGFRSEDGMLVADAAEQAVVERARELRAGGASLRAVGRTLIAEGMAPRNGKAWNPQVVARMTG